MAKKPKAATSAPKPPRHAPVPKAGAKRPPKSAGSKGMAGGMCQGMS